MVQRRLVIGISVALIAIVGGATLAFFFFPAQRPQRSTIFTSVGSSSTGGFMGGNISFIGGAMGTFDDQSVRLNGVFLVFNGTIDTIQWNHLRAKGTWQSTSLVSFTPFSQVGPNFWTGMLIVKVDLTLANGTLIRGETLTVICTLPGLALPSGVTLPNGFKNGSDYVTLTGGPVNFDEQIETNTMFSAPR